MKKEVITVYKVVYDDGSKYLSSEYRGSKNTFTYEIGKKKISKNEPIFAFLSLDKARSFKGFGRGCDFVVLECIGNLSKYQPKFRALLVGDIPKNISNFWLTIRNGNPVDTSITTGNIVDGTVFCSWVKPIRIVE